jgi:hypothetical protein
LNRAREESGWARFEQLPEAWQRFGQAMAEEMGRLSGQAQTMAQRLAQVADWYATADQGSRLDRGAAPAFVQSDPEVVIMPADQLSTPG